MEPHHKILEQEMNQLLRKRSIEKNIQIVNNRSCLLIKACSNETSEVVRRRMIDSTISDIDTKEKIRDKARELMPLVVPEFNNAIYK